MKKGITQTNVYLKPNEGRFLAMAIARVLEDLNTPLGKAQWKPESQKMRNEMLEAGISLRRKIEALGFSVPDLPPYNEGDEHEFFNIKT